MQYMYVKQFSEFLVSHFIIWADEKCETGRYQLRSPNLESSIELYNAIMGSDRAVGSLDCNGEVLKFITCNKIKIIPVLHNDQEGPGYTENYISYLRDEVSSQSGLFEKTALLVIHNSLLDTLINSAKDISNDENVFSPSEIKKSLADLIDENDSPSGEKVSRILLDYQYDLIIEDKGSMFGFRALYDAIADGDIRFHEIGLLEDPAILNMSGNDAQIRKRLDSNQKLHDEIQNVLEHYPDQLEDNLPDFGEKFIKDNFNEGSEKWKTLTYDDLRKEQDNNREQTLNLIDESSIFSDVYVRTKSESKSVQKERHVLLVVGKNNTEFDLKLTFEGAKVNLDQVNLKDKGKVLSKISNLDLRSGSRNTEMVVSGQAPDKPLYFEVSLNRPKTSEKFKFKCLVLNEGDFNVEGFRNTYLINPSKQLVILQSQETELTIGLTGHANRVLAEKVGQDFDLTEAGVIDFESLSNQVDSISFDVSHGEQSLTFLVEGAAATDNLVLPLIFDQSRKNKLFKSGFFGTFNSTKRKAYIENREVKSSTALIYLEMESLLIDSGLVYKDERSGLQLDLNTLRELSAELHDGYQALFSYYKDNNTLPSLSGWDEQYCEIVSSIVTSYHKYLGSIREKETLDSDQISIINLGCYITTGQEFITPLHPLVLSYYLKLVSEIILDEEKSFFDLPNVTLNRLNPQGLLPIIYDAYHGYSHLLAVEENCFWLKCVPQISTNYSYVTKLVNDKIEEFTSAFSILFNVDEKSETLPTLIINTVNNRENYELFLGIVNQVSRQISKKNQLRFNIHVNIYDNELIETEFDVFSELASYDAIKTAYGLNKGKNKDHADSIVDLMRKRVSHSKFTHEKCDQQDYSHLTFFRNNEEVKVVNVNPDEKLSGVTCSGLINGEASSAEKDNYITGFGLKNVEYKGIQHIEIAALLGRLMKPSRDNTTDYRDNSAIALAVNSGFKGLLDKSYDSSIWTSIIDPKVTLDFFSNQENTLLIHYSDQYTSSASYDAITVTKQTDLYDKVLEKEDAGRIEEFNAFNGEWLLKMITDGSNLRKERKGILTAYKLISCLLAKSSIIWVPMSAAEVVRVSGNIGLNMTESEFSRHIQGYKAGAISDDVLFVGFKNEKMYLLPLEVKTGAGYDKAKAIKQALELGRYLGEELLTGRTLSNKLYRSLFVRQVLMQIEKYELYSVYPRGYFDEFLSEKETWLIGDYEIGKLTDYAKGFVVANLEGHKCLETSITTIDGINVLEVPSSFMPKTINTPLIELL
ncbi:MAG: DNA phosphorothioation-dependent restriction protein DptH, partial [Colwellia sp.]